MRRNNLPNPMLHEIRSANTRPTRTALPHKSQPYAKTIERMAGVGYNRNREVSALLNAQTKGRQIGGRVNPETDYSRFGDLPNKQMAIQQNKFLKPTNDQAKEMLRSGNANRRVIAKSRYVNGIAGKGFEGENLVIPKRGRPYKGQPNSLPLMTKSKKIKKHETGVPHTHTNPNYNVYREMYGDAQPRYPNQKYYVPNPLMEKFKDAQISIIPSLIAGLGLGYGSSKMVDAIAKKPLKNWKNTKNFITGLKTLNDVSPFGPIEAAYGGQQFVDALRGYGAEAEYATGERPYPQMYVDNSQPYGTYTSDIPQIDLQSIRVGDQTLNPLQIANNQAFEFGNPQKNQWYQDALKIAQKSKWDSQKPYGENITNQLGSAFFQMLNLLQLLPQSLSTASTAGLQGTPRGLGNLPEPLSVIDSLMYGDTNPIVEDYYQQKAIGRDANNMPYDDMFALMNSQIRPSDYMQSRDALTYTNMNELPEGLKQEAGRFAMPVQRRIQPTAELTWANLVDSLYGGNSWLPAGSSGSSVWDELRATLGARGLPNAIATGNLTQVEGWNKRGQKQDLTAYYGEPAYTTNDKGVESEYIHPYAINGIKNYVTQNYLGGLPYSEKMPYHPNPTTMYEARNLYNPYAYDAVNRRLQSDAALDEFMQGAQISNIYNNEFAQTPKEKTIDDRWNEWTGKIKNTLSNVPEKAIVEGAKYLFGKSPIQNPFVNKSMNTKFTEKSNVIKKSMSNSVKNKYFVEKGKRK